MSLTRRFLAVGLTIDAFFAAVTSVAFAELLRIDGLAARRVLAVVAVAHLVKDTGVCWVIVSGLRPIERWRANEAGGSEAGQLASAGTAAYRAPGRIAIAWSIAWTLVYPVAIAVMRVVPTGSARPSGDALIATALLSLALGAAAVTLTYAISGQLIAATAGALSLRARARGIVLPGESPSLRARLAILMVCLSFAPTLWLGSLIYMKESRGWADDGRTSHATLALYALVAISWGPICAFFLNGALARPLRNIGALIEQLLRESDPRLATLRAPIYYKDEIGRLAEGVNEMTDRLAASALRIERQLHELDLAYREARDAVRARDEFLSIAAHELRTPLTAIGLSIQNLERKVRGDARPGTREELLARFGQAARQLHRFEALVQGLLDVSRIVEGRLQMDPEDLDLRELVREVVEGLSEEAERAQCAMALHAPAPLPGRWDRTRLEQVVTNLVSNAIKFGTGHPIEVEVESLGDRVRLRVRDHGIGIAPEDHARIFERFERAVSLSNYGGLGLGLWITRQIVEAAGGRIEVSSRPQEGSTFTVELPRNEGMVEGRAPESPA